MTARLITRATSPFERFRIGDHVAHIKHGDGKVTANNGERIVVLYERPNEDHRYLIEYNALWFRLYPHSLFHRNTQAVERT